MVVVVSGIHCLLVRCFRRASAAARTRRHWCREFCPLVSPNKGARRAQLLAGDAQQLAASTACIGSEFGLPSRTPKSRKIEASVCKTLGAVGTARARRREYDARFSPVRTTPKGLPGTVARVAVARTVCMPHKINTRAHTQCNRVFARRSCCPAENPSRFSINLAGSDLAPGPIYYETLHQTTRKAP